MNLRTIEGVVRRLATDAEFRARAIANPSSALSEYRLSRDEQVALSKLCGQLAGGPVTTAFGVTPNFYWS